VKITAMALDMEQLVTACARLLALAATLEGTAQDSITRSTAEFADMLHVDTARVTARANAMLADAHRNAAAAYN
jgi:hypothetical protein